MTGPNNAQLVAAQCSKLERGKAMTNTQVVTTRPQFIASLETRAVYNLLAPTEIGCVVPYDAITAAIGKDYRRMPGPITTARKQLLRDRSMVFAPIRSQGLKRLADTEIIDTSLDTVSRIRSAARRRLGALSVVKREDLPAERKVKLDTHMTLLGVMSAISTPKKIAQLEGKIAEQNALMAARSALLVLANGDSK